MRDDIIPLAMVGLYKDIYPCASLYKTETESGIDMSPVLLAALCISLFESYIYLVPDSEQITFEKCFKDAFTVMLKEKHKYTSTFNIEDDTL
jgi:hypothetical protein